MQIAVNQARLSAEPAPIDPDTLRRMSSVLLEWIDTPFTVLHNTSLEWFVGPDVRTSWHDQLAWLAPARLERYSIAFRDGIAADIRRAAPQLRGEVAAAMQAAEGWATLIDRLARDQTVRPIAELRDRAASMLEDPTSDAAPIIALASALVNAAGGPSRTDPAVTTSA